MATFIGWFVLSNHCALGEIGSHPAAQTQHGCCHNGGASQPVKEPARGQDTECCKSLHVVMSAKEKLADVSPPSVAVVFTTWVLIRDIQPQEVVVPFGDTGPPRGESFSELVLHRSLRSHAPPFLA